MIPLEPDKYYHVYNHANGNERIFREEKNYRFFLLKFQHHIVPIADVLAYCLIPNHFHFLLKMKNENELRNSLLLQSSKTLEKFVSKENTSDQISYFYSKTFSNFFSSYTQSFNKLYKRNGSLLYKNFRRKEVDSDYYFQKLVNYIHFNPVIHGLVKHPSEWKYSSFNAIVSGKPTMVNVSETIQWFDNLDNFLFNHQFPFDFEDG